VRHSDAMRKSILQMMVSVREQVHVGLGESDLQAADAGLAGLK
jgi:hypothetical protein